MARARLLPILVMLLALELAGCVGDRLYNAEPEAYLRDIPLEDGDGAFDLAVIEFDEHGGFWKPEQLEDTVQLIERRNADAERGILMVIYVHGWKHNADPDRPAGDLRSFERLVRELARKNREVGAPKPDRVVGVYIGWRGDTSSVPIHRETTFWDRRRTALRIASLNMGETFFRLTETTKDRPESRCVILGHSMGGLIVVQTLAHSLMSLMLLDGEEGVQLPVDLIVTVNPARSALRSSRFIDFLQRFDAHLELRTAGGEVRPAAGPLMVSITAQNDWATGTAYPMGRGVETMFQTFRTDHEEGAPSQRQLATRALGHVPYLTSHRAHVADGAVVIETVPDRYNDTPFWVVEVTPDVCDGHSDIGNPKLHELLELILTKNQVRDTTVTRWMFATPPDRD